MDASLVSSGCDMKDAHPASSMGCPFWGALPGGQDDLIFLMTSATSLFPNMASFCGPGLGLQHRNLWGHNSTCNRAGGAVPPHQGVDTGSPSPLVRPPRHWLAAEPEQGPGPTPRARDVPVCVLGRAVRGMEKQGWVPAGAVRFGWRGEGDSAWEAGSHTPLG